MKRSGFEEELDQLHGDGSWNPNSRIAKNRLLTWFDEVQRELGYVSALRKQVSYLSDEVVQLSVDLEREKGLNKARGRSKGKGKRLEEGDD